MSLEFWKYDHLLECLLAHFNTCEALYIYCFFSHIYHYYLHGPNGNVKQPGNDNTSNFQKIDLQVRCSLVKEQL